MSNTTATIFSVTGTNSASESQMQTLTKPFVDYVTGKHRSPTDNADYQDLKSRRSDLSKREEARLQAYEIIGNYPQLIGRAVQFIVRRDLSTDEQIEDLLNIMKMRNLINFLSREVSRAGDRVTEETLLNLFDLTRNSYRELDSMAEHFEKKVYKVLGIEPD
jgi:hypothetical protein